MHSIPQFFKVNTHCILIYKTSIISIIIAIIIIMLPHVKYDLVFSKVDFTLSAIHLLHKLHKLHIFFFLQKKSSRTKADQ